MNTPELIAKLRTRKAFFRNGGTWLMSDIPDRDCLLAADALERMVLTLGVLREIASLGDVRSDEAGWLAKKALKLGEGKTKKENEDGCQEKSS